MADSEFSCVSNENDYKAGEIVYRSFGLMPFTNDETKIIQDTLRQKLDPSYISQRNGIRGQAFAYIPEWKLVSLANEIFGFNGWSYSFGKQETELLEEDHGRYTISVSTKVRVQLKDGTFREDIGFGTCSGLKSKAQSIEKAKKDSLADGLKRALKRFGHALGNCLSDRDYVRRAVRHRDCVRHAVRHKYLADEEPPPPGRPYRDLEAPSQPPTSDKYSLKKGSSNGESKVDSSSSSSILEVQIPTPPPSIATDEPAPHGKSATDDLPRASDAGESAPAARLSARSPGGLLSLVPRNADHASPTTHAAPASAAHNAHFYGFLTVSEMLCEGGDRASPAGAASPKTPRPAHVKPRLWDRREKDRSPEEHPAEALTTPSSAASREWPEIVAEDDPSFWERLIAEEREEADKETEERVSTTRLFAQSIGLLPKRPAAAAAKDGYVSSSSFAVSGGFGPEDPFCRDVAAPRASRPPFASAFGTTEITSSFVQSSHHRSNSVARTSSYNYSRVTKSRISSFPAAVTGGSKREGARVFPHDGIYPRTRSRLLKGHRRSPRLKSIKAPTQKRPPKAPNNSQTGASAAAKKPKLKR